MVGPIGDLHDQVRVVDDGWTLSKLLIRDDMLHEFFWGRKKTLGGKSIRYTLMDNKGDSVTVETGLDINL